MARRLQSAALILALAAASARTSAEPSLLAGYSFEEDDLATGPDTFAVFRSGQGDVRLAESFRVSGYRSVEIRDAEGDRTFPELQGYFPRRTDGHVYAHFAFLTTDTTQTLNIALAGPAHFRLAKDGIAFWLAVQDGVLRHTSDSIPKRLAALHPFVWYTVDLDYDIGAGRYDLRIHEEGVKDPIVALTAQANAAAQPGSAIDKFSFVGDVEEDASNVTYYVDDVKIMSSQPERLGPFVAPGRRKLFVDLFQEYRRLEADRLQCLPVLGPEDVGLDTHRVRVLAEAGVLDTLQQALATGWINRKYVGPPELSLPVEAAADWGRGCLNLAQSRHKEAFAEFERAHKAMPQARLYALSSALALIGLRQFEEAEARLDRVAGDFGDDPRPQVAYGALGLARGDIPQALAWLRPPAGRAVELPFVTEPAAEKLYFALLFGDDPVAARELAQRRTTTRAQDGVAVRWLERQGDAAYYAGDRAAAQRVYEAAAQQAPQASLWLKLADLAFLRGDLEGERRLRERVYGSLAPR